MAAGVERVSRVRSAQSGALVAVLLTLLAVAFFSRDRLFLHLVYALAAVYLLGRLWAHRALASVHVTRRYDDRAYLGQEIRVTLAAENRGRLPVLWLRLNDAVPAELAGGEPVQRVVSLGPRERHEFRYTLHGRRRGYHQFGPISLESGDLLGSVAYEAHREAGRFLIVYPRILSLAALDLPTQSPFGTLPGRRRLVEDPARIRGTRDYQPGDSMRTIDWKSSARLGMLQVRRTEPAIALETSIVLNLDGRDYPGAQRYEAAERAITVAASLAVRMAGSRQAVGLWTNGRDPLATPGGAALPGRGIGLAARKGQEHVMHLLDLLARVEVASEGEATRFVELVGAVRDPPLPWGSTVALVTSVEAEGLLPALVALRHRGLAVLLVLTCPARDLDLTARRVAQIGVQVIDASSERELNRWR